ncbi:MAG: 6-bladed beta-propeller [Bacteroidota bacterium]|nr:6-bladed beta-propeller [Bacteroidota bacterium]
MIPNNMVKTILMWPRFILAPYFRLSLFIPLAIGHVAATAIHAQEIVEVSGQDRYIDPDFEEVYRLGALEGDSWEMFSMVQKVGFDEQGNLYVFDDAGSRLSPDLRILVFDASGAFVHEFGTRGEGPGEFMKPNGYAVARDGTTIVRDGGRFVYHLFDASGRFKRMVRNRTGTIESGGGGDAVTIEATAVMPIVADPRGEAVFTITGEATINIQGSNGTPANLRTIDRHALAGNQAQIETVAETWRPPRANESENEQDIVSFSKPSIFEPRLLYDLLPDGQIVYSDSSAYALSIASAEQGDILRTITRPFRPKLVTPRIEKEYTRRKEARDAKGKKRTRSGLRTSLSVRGKGVGQNPALVEAMLGMEEDDKTFYNEIPVVERLQTTWEGRIWVQRRAEEFFEDGPMDVLAADGEYVGTYRAGATALPDAFGPNGLTAFIEYGDRDVARIVVRRLPEAVR